MAATIKNKNMRKYCEYCINVKKTDKGFIWEIWNKPGGEKLQSSNDEDYDEEDRYFDSKEVAYQEGAEAIQDYYT